jgi:hypothetical protein
VGIERFADWEDSAFFGKLTNALMAEILQNLLGGIVHRERQTEYGFADFFIDGFGLVEVTTSKNPKNNLKSLKKWYRISLLHRLWVLVPDGLVRTYQKRIHSDFEHPIPSSDLPPKGAILSNITVVSFEALFRAVGSRLGDERLPERALALIKSSDFLRNGERIVHEWRRRFVEYTAMPHVPSRA